MKKIQNSTEEEERKKIGIQSAYFNESLLKSAYFSQQKI